MVRSLRSMPRPKPHIGLLRRACRIAITAYNVAPFGASLKVIHHDTTLTIELNGQPLTYDRFDVHQIALACAEICNHYLDRWRDKGKRQRDWTENAFETETRTPAVAISPVECREVRPVFGAPSGVRCHGS